MPSPTHTRPVATLYPSSQEDVNAYMAAIRLASTVRNSMDAPKAGVDTKEAAVDADAYGRHHHKFPPQTPANLTTPGRHETVPIPNEDSSALSAFGTTKAGLVRPQDSQPSSSRRSMSIVDTPTGATFEARKQHHGYFPPPDPPMSTGDSSILKDTAADIPTGATLEARKPHHGYFPPPDPLIGSTQAPPGKPISRHTGPIPITNHHGPNGIKWYGPGDIPPQCQLYAANTETNNGTFAVCPVTRRTSSNTTHTLTTHQLHTGDTFNPHILATRATAMCEAPTGFKQQLACGKLDGWFALPFFILFGIIWVAWMIRRKHNTRTPDEELGTATSPRFFLIASTNSSPKAKAKKPQALKVSTDSSSEAELREELCRRLEWRLGTEQYESVAERSASRRAIRADGEGRVRHDAAPIAVLPSSFAEELPAHHRFEPLAPSL